MTHNLVTLSEFGEPFPKCPQPAEVLARCSLFENVSQVSKDELVSESHLAYADRGESLWTENSPSRFFVVVGNGIVGISHLTFNKIEVTIDVLGPGSFGGLHLSDPDARFTTTATSYSNLWYLKIPNHVWTQVSQGESFLQERLYREILTKMRRRIDLLAGLLTGNQEQRIGMVLSTLSDQFPDQPSGRKARIPLTLQGLADLTKTDPATAKTILSRWNVFSGPNYLRIDHPDDFLARVSQNSAATSL